MRHQFIFVVIKINPLLDNWYVDCGQNSDDRTDVERGITRAVFDYNWPSATGRVAIDRVIVEQSNGLQSLNAVCTNENKLQRFLNLPKIVTRESRWDAKLNLRILA